MFRLVARQADSAARQAVASATPSSTVRTLATLSPVNPSGRQHKVVLVGGGSAGLTISHQLLRSGKFSQDDIAVVDPADWHHYQPGWTLVGGGLRNKEELRKPLKSMLDPKLKFYNHSVATFSPEENYLTLGNGDKIGYKDLIVVPGIQIEYGKIQGLPEALADPNSLVSSIYGYETCDKVFGTIRKLHGGQAIFTLPAGTVKCAGAPQKIMWLALDYWKRAGLYNPQNPAESKIKISFATALAVMFGAPKYNARLEELRLQRAVEGLFEHDLVSIEGDTATFALPDGKEQVKKKFDLMHVVPKMGPYAFVKDSALANTAGFVDIDSATLRHNRFRNVWSAGDAAGLPTSKTSAAITSQAPVLVHNLMLSTEGKEPDMDYDGYTSCPLFTEYGKVMLAEFGYGGLPKETFARFGIDQGKPRKSFYHLKKDFFPWVYFNSMVKGTWAGPKGWIRT